MNLTELRQTIAAAVKSTGLPRVDAYTPETVSPPCAFVGSPAGLYDQTFDGALTVTLPVWLLVGAQDMKRSQQALDPYLDPDDERSIATALHEVPEIRVAGWQEPGIVEVAGGSYVGVRFDVQVFA